MTTSGMSYGQNGLQDEKINHHKLPPGLVPPSKGDQTDLPNVLLCFKTIKDDKSKKDKGSGKQGDGEKKSKKRAKSRELRSGILYVGCECERRNGLQDQCPRSECQGAPECMTKPPSCLPSEFAQGKHLAKKYAQLAKEREEFAKKMKGEKGDGSSGGAAKGKDAKTDYDCFPLDKMIKEGLPCPICDRVIDGCDGLAKHVKPKDVTPGPIIIDFSTDCLCCPG